MTVKPNPELLSGGMCAPLLSQIHQCLQRPRQKPSMRPILHYRILHTQEYMEEQTECLMRSGSRAFLGLNWGPQLEIPKRQRDTLHL